MSKCISSFLLTVLLTSSCYWVVPRSKVPVPENSMTQPGAEIEKFRARQSDRIDELSDAFELVSLRRKNIPDGSFELRIWGDHGEDYKSCFVISGTRQSPEVRLVRAPLKDWKMIRKLGGGFELVEFEFVMSKHEQLKIAKLLERYDIHSPLLFLFENRNRSLVPDDDFLVLEFKEKNNYSFVSYWHSSETQDAIKAKSMCHEFELLVKTELGCRVDG